MRSEQWTLFLFCIRPEPASCPAVHRLPARAASKPLSATLRGGDISSDSVPRPAVLLGRCPALGQPAEGGGPSESSVFIA